MLVALIPLWVLGCAGRGPRAGHALDRAAFPDFDVEDLGPTHERKDSDANGVPVFGYIVEASTHAPLVRGLVILGDDSGGSLAREGGRYFFLARRGTHVLVGRSLGYEPDSVEIVVDSAAVRVDFLLTEEEGIILYD